MPFTDLLSSGSGLHFLLLRHLFFQLSLALLVTLVLFFFLCYSGSHFPCSLMHSIPGWLHLFLLVINPRTSSEHTQQLTPLASLRMGLLLHPINSLLLFILLLGSAAFDHSVEGRSSFRLLEIASGFGDQKARALIGSRPPMCERRCRGCSHCEAIQVPVIPGALNMAMASASDLRGDVSSNYKPLSWKCKCGDLIFNP